MLPGIERNVRRLHRLLLTGARGLPRMLTTQPSLNWWFSAVAKSATKLSETDLYRPVRDYLEAQGYVVRSEVRNCDIAAVRGDDLIVVELKRQMGLTLLAQAVERQKITDSVYVAVPRPDNMRKWQAQTKTVQGLLRRLEIGLILVSTKSTTKARVQAGVSGYERSGNPETAAKPKKPLVQVLFHPVPFERRKRKSAHRAVLTEINGRSGDFNQGGSCRRKLVTAYRENAIHIACCLDCLGPMSAKALREHGACDKTYSILYTNVYGWFERIDKGTYAISPAGRQALAEYPELASHYLKCADGGKKP